MQLDFTKMYEAIAAWCVQTSRAFAPHAAWRGPTQRRRDRTPNSNAAERAREGVPHGVSGAKLARLALAGHLTKRW